MSHLSMMSRRYNIFFIVFLFSFYQSFSQQSRNTLEKERDINISKIEEAEKIIIETENSKKIKQLEVKHLAALNAIQQSSVASGGSVDAEGNVTFNPSGNYLLPSPNDSLEDQINMVRNMVAEDPDRVAQVIQGWSNNE